MAGLAASIALAGPAATQAPANGGNVSANTPNGPTDAVFTEEERRAGKFCNQFETFADSALEQTSANSFAGTYSVTDDAGVAHSYTGPLRLRFHVPKTYERPEGSFSDNRCEKDLGHRWPIAPNASLSSNGAVNGRSISCTYGSGSYGRDSGRDTNIHYTLVGTCTITDGGIEYVATTTETHDGITHFFAPGTTPGSGPVLIKWLETFTAVTKCISKSCRVPEKPPPDRGKPSNPDEPGKPDKPGKPETPAPPPAKPAPITPVSGSGTVSAQVSAASPTGTSVGTSSLAGFSPGTPPPISPGTPTGGSAPGQSQGFLPSSAPVPGPAGVSARGPAVMPAVGVLPEAQAAPQHSMVAHRGPLGVPGVAWAGAGLFLAFVCFVGVPSILIDRRTAFSLGSAGLCRSRSSHRQLS